MGGCSYCSSMASELYRAPVHIYVCITCFVLLFMSKYSLNPQQVFLAPLPLTTTITWFLPCLTINNTKSLTAV